MQTGRALWIVFVVLGALLWLTSIGVWTHPAYRLVLMVAVFSWCGYVVRTPTSTGLHHEPSRRSGRNA